MRGVGPIPVRVLSANAERARFLFNRTATLTYALARVWLMTSDRGDARLVDLMLLSRLACRCRSFEFSDRAGLGYRLERFTAGVLTSYKQQSRSVVFPMSSPKGRHHAEHESIRFLVCSAVVFGGV